MVITIDTNVLYQALSSNLGASFRILQLIRKGNFKLAISQSVFSEYVDVLTRPTSLNYFELKQSDVENILRYIAYISEKYDPKFLFRPNLKDENDNMFVELAIVSQSRFLITNNIKDFISGELIFDNFELVTPSEFLWRQLNG
ncbi:MAG: putative toxin-antitoxin system toxin component, PIN family [Proteobacteria bacterium]|nr:putative toxin-antitoxin system toxin component, PIN family [Pseudomonadota bacterium]